MLSDVERLTNVGFNIASISAMVVAILWFYRRRKLEMTLKVDFNFRKIGVVDSERAIFEFHLLLENVGDVIAKIGQVCLFCIPLDETKIANELELNSELLPDIAPINMINDDFVLDAREVANVYGYACRERNVRAFKVIFVMLHHYEYEWYNSCEELEKRMRQEKYYLGQKVIFIENDGRP